jgi:hypothetical protein
MRASACSILQNNCRSTFAGAQLDSLLLFLRRPIQRVSRGINITQMLVGLAGVAQQLQLDVKRAPFETFELTPVYIAACRRSPQIGLGNC